MIGKLVLRRNDIMLECYNKNILVDATHTFQLVSEALDFVNSTKSIEEIELYQLPDNNYTDEELEECLHTEFIPLLDEDYLFEMARIPKKYTGLPYDIWLDPMGADRKNTHNIPRLKLYVDADTLVPVTISDNPEIPQNVQENLKVKIKDFLKIKKFIIKYKLLFLMHYYRQLDDVQISLLMKNIMKVPNVGELDPAQVIDIVDNM